MGDSLAVCGAAPTIPCEITLRGKKGIDERLKIVVSCFE
jgi:hypothetical protein